MYDELIIQIRQLQHWFKPNESECFDPYEILGKAADAIEELQAVVDGLTAQTNMVFEKTEGRTVIKFEPKWIPVTEENDGEV